MPFAGLPGLHRTCRPFPNARISTATVTPVLPGHGPARPATETVTGVAGVSAAAVVAHTIDGALLVTATCATGSTFPAPAGTACTVANTLGSVLPGKKNAPRSAGAAEQPSWYAPSAAYGPWWPWCQRPPAGSPRSARIA